MLNEFEAMASGSGHQKPFRNLHEIRSKINSANYDPTKSELRSVIVHNACRSFVQDCKVLDSAQDHDMLDELSEIEGVDAGEALLLEYALRTPDSIIVSADKKMVRGLCSPEGDKFRATLRGRILHLERVFWLLAKPMGWVAARNKVSKAEDCDTAISDALHSGLSEAVAEAQYYKMMVDFERTSRGLLRDSIS